MPEKCATCNWFNEQKGEWSEVDQAMVYKGPDWLSTLTIHGWCQLFPQLYLKSGEDFCGQHKPCKHISEEKEEKTMGLNVDFDSLTACEPSEKDPVRFIVRDMVARELKQEGLGPETIALMTQMYDTAVRHAYLDGVRAITNFLNTLYLANQGHATSDLLEDLKRELEGYRAGQAEVDEDA